MRTLGFLKPLLIIVGIALLFFLLNMFGPWNLAIPFAFIRAFLMALGGVLAFFALSVFFSWLLDAKNRRAQRELLESESYDSGETLEYVEPVEVVEYAQPVKIVEVVEP